jgi:hypothetical protein
MMTKKKTGRLSRSNYSLLSLLQRGSCLARHQKVMVLQIVVFQDKVRQELNQKASFVTITK